MNLRSLRSRLPIVIGTAALLLATVAPNAAFANYDGRKTDCANNGCQPKGQQQQLDQKPPLVICGHCGISWPAFGWR